MKNGARCVAFLVSSHVVDGLSPFLTDIETVRDNSEELLKMIKRVDAYTSTLEARVNDLF